MRRFSGTDAVLIARLATADEGPRAMRRLEETGSVTYGAYTVTAESLIVQDTTYPWSQVRRKPLRPDSVVQTRQPNGKWRDLEIPEAKTPHSAVLLDLIRHQVDS
ncbi:hypothetical protein [Streptantibioticus cattleyicolor]|uniref:Uncharacterized protein n=1 Tax=Streptantibioticus cattleyicolor (strain ATCC 35852 / DSM 46488 / JCM 4925 / NBRC 14057 / NRRL 8057) TaxID=1003195 RepID=F8JN15_STREN|nr:hypothetical protein [Streptantibioticus cattleyicolor]AEW98264.1 hypothetical protein SCATT_p00710 [Streptantibioticus cattleyicolor NRRL 8057 = DSM 46488]CCB72673.1 protein of unknown function [Streptantibioticus cattleyicolor NRRL 8057 = DSM 46488]